MLKSKLLNAAAVQKYIFSMKFSTHKTEETKYLEDVKRGKILTEEFRSQLPFIREKNINPGKLTLAEKQPIFITPPNDGVGINQNKNNYQLFSVLTNIYDELPEMETPKQLNSMPPTSEEFQDTLEESKTKGCKQNEYLNYKSLKENKTDVAVSQKLPVLMSSLEREAINIDLSLVGLQHKDGNLLTDELAQHINTVYFQTSEILDVWYCTSYKSGSIWKTRLDDYLIEQRNIKDDLWKEVTAAVCRESLNGQEEDIRNTEGAMNRVKSFIEKCTAAIKNELRKS